MKDTIIDELKNKIISGEKITRDEALKLVEVPLEELSQAADEIRKHFCGDTFDLCGVISVKGGRCSEDCKYCAQGKCSHTDIPSYSLKDKEVILEDARLRAEQGIHHYCLVSMGHHLSDREVDALCDTVREMKENINIRACVSGGLLGEAALRKLKEAGVVRLHNNLETSPDFFKTLCTTHSYQEKKDTIRAAQKVGLQTCCGGLFGLGESWEDRVDLAMELRELDPDSVPVNIFDPVPGTPLGYREVITEQDIRRVIAIFRFILPDKLIRLAAGRDYLEDTGLRCMESGCNATITGDMLTVMGVSIEKDFEQIRDLGYQL